MAEVEEARADGRWEAAYAAQRKAVVPADLQRGPAPKGGAVCSTARQRQPLRVIYRVGAAKKAETRERQIEKLVAMLERGEKIHG